MTVLIEIAIIVGVLALAVSMVRWRFLDPALWAKRSEKLADDYGIALRPDIAVQVARHLRRQAALSTAFTLVVVVLVNHLLTGSGGRSSGGDRVLLVVVPLLTVVHGLVVALPSWRKARARRVTHLIRPTPRQTFTPREWLLLRVGVLVTVAGGLYSLSRHPSDVWWAAWLGALAAAAVAWRTAANLILSRPAQASDDLELGWDDVLRHKEVRDLTILAAWGPALAVVPLGAMSGSSVNLLPFYAVIGIVIALSQAFKQGRPLWRRTWDGLDPA